MSKKQDSNLIPEWVLKTRKNWAISDAKRDEGLTEPEDVKIFKNLSYSDYGTASLLDVYVPLNASSEDRLPVIINIHGGGYFYGDKELYRFYAMDMVHDGFAVVNINYRLCPENKFPAAIEDINDVFVWVEAHAAEYGLDASKIFMMGDSAGAQLVSHYAAINSNPGFAKYYSLKTHNLKISGISLACGFYDLLKNYRLRYIESANACYFGNFKPQKIAMLNVLKAIDANYPPAFIFTAPNDFLYKNCKPMAALINKRGGRAVAKVYGTPDMKKVAHVFHCNLKTEIGATARRDQGAFFNECLKTK